MAIAPIYDYCSEHGGEIRTETVINPMGENREREVCVFPDGTSCEAWDFYRGECSRIVSSSGSNSSLLLIGTLGVLVVGGFFLFR
jgi:hypothetical protein